MARARNKLNTKIVAGLAAAGRHSDGGGLYLVIDKTGDAVRSRWLYLFTQCGTRREMGLGPYPGVSLAAARKARDGAELIVRDGGDPIEVRKRARSDAIAKPTFGEMADRLIEAKRPEWKSEVHGAQWVMTMTTYCAPIRKRPIDEIDTEAVLSVLRPIWATKAETASRVRGRIEAVIDAARALGHIPQNEANPARWRGHLDKLLPKQQKLTRGHHAAMAYADIPAFLERLRQRDAISARALEFTILTAARSGEVLGARWSEFDLEANVWTLPAARMKAGRIHRVPLSGAACAVLGEMAKIRTSDFVFPGSKPSKPLSNMAMEMVLRRMSVPVTVHGFRSSFRDWAGNETEFPREIAETALAHVIGDKAEQAYRRGDALERRRVMMAEWADFCEPRCNRQGDNAAMRAEASGKDS